MRDVPLSGARASSPAPAVQPQRAPRALPRFTGTSRDTLANDPQMRRAWAQSRQTRQRLHDDVNDADYSNTTPRSLFSMLMNNGSRLRFIRDRVARYSDNIREMQSTIARFEGMAADAHRQEVEAGTVDWGQVSTLMRNVDVTSDMLVEAVRRAETEISRMLTDQRVHRSTAAAAIVSPGSVPAAASPSTRAPATLDLDDSLRSFSETLANLNARLERVSNVILSRPAGMSPVVALPPPVEPPATLEPSLHYRSSSPIPAPIGPFSVVPVVEIWSHRQPAHAAEASMAESRRADRGVREHRIAMDSPPRRPRDPALRVSPPTVEEEPLPSSHAPLVTPARVINIDGVDYRDCFGRWLSVDGRLAPVDVTEMEPEHEHEHEHEHGHETGTEHERGQDRQDEEVRDVIKTGSMTRQRRRLARLSQS